MANQDFNLQIEISSNIDKAVDGFASLEKVVKSLDGVFQAASKSLNTFAENLDKLEKNFKKFGRELTQNVTAPIVALAGLSLKNIYDAAIDSKGTKAMNEFAAAVQNLKREFNLFLQDIGQHIAPAFTRFINLVSGLLSEFRKLNPEIKSFIIAVAAIAAALGPTSLAISSFLSVTIQITKVVSTLISFGPKLIAFFANPLTAAIALIAGMASILELSLKLQKSGSGFGESLYLSLKLVANYINKEFWPLLSTLVDRLQDTFNKTKGNFFGRLLFGNEGENSFANDLSKTMKSYGNYYEKEFAALKERLDKQLATVGSSVEDAMTFGLITKFKKLRDEMSRFFEEYTKKQNELSTKRDEQELDDAIKRIGQRQIEFINAIKQSAYEIKRSFSGGLTDAFLDFAQGAKTAEQAFNDFANNFLRRIAQMIIEAQIFRIVSGMGSTNSSLGSLAQIGYIPTAGFADGGYVSGAGTGTSDSIPAWLSNGEFVMTAASVKKYGAGFFDRLNSLSRSGAQSSSKIGHFADGGLVSSSQQAPQVVLENKGSEKQVTRTEFDPTTSITTVFLEDVSKNGPMSKAIQSNFGVRRSGFR